MSGLPDVLNMLGATSVQSWGHDAACRDEDPELFFPVGTSGPAVKQAARAKAVCAVCPVKAECLADNLNVSDGIFGGLDADERRALKARKTGELARPKRPAAPVITVEYPEERPSTSEARRLLLDILTQFQAQNFQVVTPGDFPGDFALFVRGREWIGAQLSKLADAGCLTRTERKGHYLFAVQLSEVRGAA